MVAFNVSADDASPLISYSPAGAWTDSPYNDLSAPLYSHSSWHTSSSYGSSATIQFNGTGIWFYGAKRPHYGPYSITIDGQSVFGNAQCQKSTFQQLLGGRADLSNGLHTAVFTNTGSGSFIDLDSIVFETETGSPNAAMAQTTMDDTSPAITYLPTQEDWAFANMPGWFNDTLHFTQTGGAQAQFAFNGDAVAIYGTVSPFLADYIVTTDGATRWFQSSSQGLASDIHLSTLLYFASSLTSGPHNLTLTANPAQCGQYDASTFMDIDRIVIFNASNVTTTENDHGNITLPTIIGIPQKPAGVPPSLTGLNTSSQSGPNLASNATQGYTHVHSSKRLKMAVIGGGIAGVVMLLLLIFIAFLIYRRPHPQERSLCRKLSLWQPRTPKLPVQPPPTRSISLPIYVSGTSDLEKMAPYTIPLGPNENLSMDDAQVKLPWVPETCVTRDARNGRSGEFHIQSHAQSKAPNRRPRPPSLRLFSGD